MKINLVIALVWWQKQVVIKKILWCFNPVQKFCFSLHIWWYRIFKIFQPEPSSPALCFLPKAYFSKQAGYEPKHVSLSYIVLHFYVLLHYVIFCYITLCFFPNSIVLSRLEQQTHKMFCILRLGKNYSEACILSML